jgi:hypothetical protein
MADFKRPYIVDNNFSPPWVRQTQLTELLLGNSTSNGYIAIPATTYSEACTVVQNLNGNSQVFINVHAVNLGSITDLRILIEFQDPDNTAYWIPSKEPAHSGTGGVEEPLRTDPLASHEWAITAAGNYVIASRQEHPHFMKFRVRARAAGGSASASTDVRLTWNTNGGRALVSDNE